MQVCQSSKLVCCLVGSFIVR